MKVKKLTKEIIVAVSLIGILAFGVFILLKRNGSKTDNSSLNKKTFILERYGTLEGCRLSTDEISSLTESKETANTNCAYKVVDQLTGPGGDRYLFTKC